MKKIFFLFIYLCIQQLAFSQSEKAFYLIKFKDKNVSDFSINTPTNYLSTKSIERRLKQHIAINTSDLPLNTSYTEQIKALNVKIIHRSKWLNAISIACNNSATIETIKGLPFVLEIQKISVPIVNSTSNKFELEKAYTPVPPTKSIQSATSSTGLDYGFSYSQAHQLNVDCLHNMGYQGEGVTVAILDAGFMHVDTIAAFDSLRMNNRLLGTWDFVTGDSMVFEDNIHGMEVLSCMAGYLPGQLIGTAPRASYWLLRTEDAASESLQEELNWLMGAEFADSVGADVINSSLAYTTFDNIADNHTYADMNGHTTIAAKAATWAADKGISVVISAGNYGAGPWYKIGTPADADSILTVGAVDSLGVITNFSSHGPAADGRVKPCTVARGLEAIVATDFGGISYANGTSFSSPITAGAVACLRQANPTASNMELIDKIQHSANQFNNPDTLYGYGIPDFCAANTFLAGVQNFNEPNASLKIYPNPFDETLTVTFTSEKKQFINITLFDMLGREVLKQNIPTNSIHQSTTLFTDTKQLKAGIYLVCINANNQHYYQKVIKN